jgi:hypothetical protein
MLPVLAAPRANDAPLVHRERMAHVVGARLDIGRAWDFGLAYLHSHESLTTRNGLGALIAFQYGVDGRLIRDEGAFRAGLGLLTGRISMMGDAGGFGMEASLGSTFKSEAPVVAEGGFFFGAYFVELGYAYRFPIGSERPEWLASHQFALRIQVPVFGHHERTRIER